MDAFAIRTLVHGDEKIILLHRNGKQTKFLNLCAIVAQDKNPGSPPTKHAVYAIAQQLIKDTFVDAFGEHTTSIAEDEEALKSAASYRITLAI